MVIFMYLFIFIYLFIYIFIYLFYFLQYVTGFFIQRGGAPSRNFPLLVEVTFSPFNSSKTIYFIVLKY